MTTSNSERPYALNVCTSCRLPGEPRQPFYQRSGYKLFKELESKLAASDLGDRVEVRAAECLSICRRPCGIAVSAEGSWSYLFGDQEPKTSAKDIVKCLSLYIEQSDGFMPRSERPKGLRAAILGRIPPIGGPDASV